MTGRAAETAPEGEGRGNRLPGSAADASTQATRGQIVARERPENLLVEPERCLLVSRGVVESLSRPAASAGRRKSGKSRFEDFDGRRSREEWRHAIAAEVEKEK